MINNSPNKRLLARRLRVTTRGAATVGGCLAIAAVFFFSSDLAAWYFSEGDTASSLRIDAAARIRRLPKKEDWVEIGTRNGLKKTIVAPADEIQLASFEKPLPPHFDRPVITTAAKRAAPVRRHRARRSSLVVNPEMIAYTLVIYPKNGEIRTRIEPTKTAASKRSSPRIKSANPRVG